MVAKHALQIVREIDGIVRFDGWQQTVAGEREVQKALRKTLLRYQLHKDQELFDKAYGYIEQDLLNAANDGVSCNTAMK